MNILITGGSGFIGRHLVESMLTQNKVYVLTRNDILVNPKVTTIVTDLTNRNYTKLLPPNIDCVVHLAQSDKYRDFPEGVSDMFQVNLAATIELLEWSRINGVQKFLYTSSANVYSASLSLLTEKNQCNPSSFYGASKLSAEHLIQQYQKYFQTDILRCFTVYGPNQQNMLIANMIERIKYGLQITLAKGKGIYLTPIYVNDLIKIINRIIVLPNITESRVLNACGDYVNSLADIVMIIQKILGQSAVVKNIDEEPSYFTGSNQKIHEIIGDLRLISIEEGLELTINN